MLERQSVIVAYTQAYDIWSGVMFVGPYIVIAMLGVVRCM